MNNQVFLILDADQHIFTAAANAPSSSLSSASTAVAPRTGMEQTAELFQHSLSNLREDSQEFLLLHVEEDSIRSIKRGENSQGEANAMDADAFYC